MSQNSDSEPDEAPDYLTGLSKQLAEVPNVDADLAAILAEHILLEVPADSCVAEAKTAIAALAAQRAAPPEPVE